MIQVLGVGFGVLLIIVGILESLFTRYQRLHRLTPAALQGADAARLWQFNRGFYNVVWGAGAIAGSVLLAGDDPGGRQVLLFVCLAHIVLGTVLAFNERRLWPGAVVEAVPPLVITVLLVA